MYNLTGKREALTPLDGKLAWKEGKRGKQHPPPTKEKKAVSLFLRPGAIGRETRGQLKKKGRETKGGTKKRGFGVKAFTSKKKVKEKREEERGAQRKDKKARPSMRLKPQSKRLASQGFD